MNKQFKRAFTLIELLLVVAVLGLLATFVVIRFTGVQSGARDAKRQSELNQYKTSLEVYAIRNNSLYPPAVSGENAVNLCAALSLTNCPDDPSAPAARYKYRVDAGRTNYVLSATLEKPNASGNTEYFVLCANGNVGKTTTAPSSATCPI